MERTGRGKLPGWYLDRPDELRGDEFYIDAFFSLSTERQFGQCIGPIPWSKIIDYGILHGLNYTMLNVFHVVLRILDEGYLEWQRDDQRARNKKKNGPV